MPNPYIGITDFTNFDQVERMLEVFKLYGGDHLKYRLHVGVMMNRKSLLRLTVRRDESLVSRELIESIFASPQTMNCLHYADDDINVVNNLVAAIRWGGEGINAVQLDMDWPNPDHIGEAVLRSGKKLEVILQIGSSALERMENDPSLVVAELRGYTRFIHHVLLDKSGGRGIEMNAEMLRPFISAIRSELPELGIAVAGGLGPETLHLVRPLVRDFPDLSIDAQSMLRPSGSTQDPIDWNLASEYLAKSLDIMGHIPAAVA